MSPAAWKLVGVPLLVLVTASGTWKVQDWRYGKPLAEQVGLHKDDLADISKAAAAQLRADQEERLATNDQTHHEALTNAQKDQARLRDRLANFD